MLFFFITCVEVVSPWHSTGTCKSSFRLWQPLGYIDRTVNKPIFVKSEGLVGVVS